MKPNSFKHPNEKIFMECLFFSFGEGHTEKEKNMFAISFIYQQINSKCQTNPNPTGMIQSNIRNESAWEYFVRSYYAVWCLFVKNVSNIQCNQSSIINRFSVLSRLRFNLNDT